MTYKYMQDKIVSKNKEMSSLKKFPAKKKPKMTMKESAKFLLSSSYIRDLALLVISYGMCINIVEVSWKAKLKAAFPEPNSYSAFMGNFSSATGAVTLIMMLLGRTIFQKFGWRFAALVTPCVSDLDPCQKTSIVFSSSHLSVIRFPDPDDWSHRSGVLCHEHFRHVHDTGRGPRRHDAANVGRNFGSCAEYPQQEFQVLFV
jgi:TLC ATP/ADP transporter